MAGVKGKSGGVRKNAGGARKNSGGARPGAGRKPKAKQKAVRPPVIPASGSPNMLQLLQNIALGLTEATSLQVRAAIAAVQYTHTKKGDGGKKEEGAAKANRAATGKFASPAGPKLVHSR